MTACASNDAQVLRVLARRAQARRARLRPCRASRADRVPDRAAVAAGLTAPKHHAWAKPTVVEREAAHRIIAMAEALDVPIQIFHVSGPEPAEEIARARKRGLKVWGETCPQYLTLSADDLDRPGFEGAKFIFSPAPRSKAEQQGLWDYIRDGVIDVISSDHSPTRFDDPKGKKVAGENAPFNKVPNGVPGRRGAPAAGVPRRRHQGPHRRFRNSSTWSAPRRRGCSGCFRARARSRSAAMPTSCCGTRTRPSRSPTR